LNNFNFISPIYDLLSKAVFWGRIQKSQLEFFAHIKPNDKVLIIGGGTGQILNELNKQQKKLTVIYLEKSKIMVANAKRRLPFEFLDIEFKCGDALTTNWPHCNIIITNFFLDVFNEKNLLKIMDKIKESQRLGDFWICTDFVSSNNFIKRYLIKMMYSFFRLTTNLEGNHLINFDKLFHTSGYNKIESKTFYHKMIKSSIYSKGLK
jgi:tRNA (cmo5U34)-methyltransferase